MGLLDLGTGGAGDALVAPVLIGFMHVRLNPRNNSPSRAS
jgi:hypothetical protein